MKPTIEESGGRRTEGFFRTCGAEERISLLTPTEREDRLGASIRGRKARRTLLGRKGGRDGNSCVFAGMEGRRPEQRKKKKGNATGSHKDKPSGT